MATTRKKAAERLEKVVKIRWATEIARYRVARGDEAEGWDDRFEALGAILESKLWAAGGFGSEAAFLKAEAPELSPRTVRDYVRVAHSFSPEQEQKYGISRLGLLLDYLEARGGAPLPPGAKLDPERQKLRLSGNEMLDFPDASAASLRSAIRNARGSKSGPGVSPRVAAVKAALHKLGFRAVAVSERGGRFSLAGLDPEKLARLLRTKLPA